MKYEVIYERYGVIDMRYFESISDFINWYERQIAIDPETNILSILNTSMKENLH